MTIRDELSALLRRRAPHRVLADAEAAGALAARLDGAAQARLGRSLALFHAGAAECGGCAMELRALEGAAYDLRRHGLSFVAEPGAADVLLVSGAVTHALRGPLAAAWVAMPAPKWVVALGGCAIDGGIFAGGYAVLGGAGAVVPVDLVVPGCPPSPAEMLRALLALIEANA